MELKINPRDKILVLSPHPDDESIGCGGFLLKYAKQCDVILLTDGAKGNREWPEEKTKRVRHKEFKTVMASLGIQEWKALGIPDLTLDQHINCLRSLNLKKYRYILVPNREETHSDHKIIYGALKKEIKRLKLQTRILEYEVWTPILYPTHHIDISELIDKKTELIQLYECPLMHIDYDKRIKALNYYRGIHYNCGYAECYKLTDCGKKENILTRIREKF